MNTTMPDGLMNRSLSLVVQSVFAAAILITLYLLSLQNYLLFHGIIEIAGIVIAFSIFILVWNTRRVITNTFFLIVGISFLFTGSIDLFHTLAYKGMGIFAGNSSDLPTQLWIAARYFQSITFFIATLFIGKSITKDRNYDTGIILAACAGFSGLLLASIFLWHNFPSCFVEGSGLTPFKIFSEYIISIILIATVVILVIKRKSFETGVWQLLIAAQIFLILGELAFTSYISVYGFMNMLGHLFRLISVYLFYRAFVVVGLTRPYDLLFRELIQEKDALKKSELRFRTMADWTGDWEYWIDSGRNFVYLSPSVEQITGYRPEEFKADPGLIDRIVYQDDRMIWDAHVPLHTTTEETIPAEIEFRLVHKDGSVRWISHICRSIYLDDGTCIGRRISNRDITEQKRSEEALRDSQAKLAEAMDLAHLVNWEFDVPTGIFTFNDRFYAMFGTTAEREGGYRMPAELYAREFVHPDDAYLVADEVNKAIAATDPDFTQQVEHRIIRRDGEVRHHIVRIAITTDAEGRTVKIHGANQDITERKQAEDLLREEQQFSKLLIDSLPGIFFLYSYPDHKLIRWNKLHETLFGYTAEEMKDRLATDWHLPEFKDAVLKATEEVMENGRSSVESSLLAKDGHPVPLLLTGVRFEAHGQLYYMGIGIDITERKRAEEALRESEERFRTILSSMQFGIVIVDAQTHLILEANNKSLEMIGGSTDHIVGSVCHRFICPAESGRCPVTDLGQTVDSSERVLLTLQGDKIPILKSVVTATLGGKKVLIESFVDITERKKAEDLLKRFNEELEEKVKERTVQLQLANLDLEKEVGEHARAEDQIRASLDEKVLLLREIHHRVKNNFQIILSLLSLQSRSVGDERVTRAMRESQNRIRAMAFVHEKMYTTEDFARIDLESYAKYLTTQLFAFFEVRPGTISLTLDVKNIFIDINTAIPLGLVINELVSNSLKHAFPEGRKGRITISILDDHKELTLTYQDDGVGFSKDCDWQTTESLGFKLIRVLIDQLDGTIEREPVKGTCFIIRVMRKTDEQGHIHGTFNPVSE